MAATLHEIKPPEYRNVVTALRNLADDIEAGHFGEITSCGVVTFGDTLEIFGSGSDASGPTIALLFQAARQRFAQEIEQFGR